MTMETNAELRQLFTNLSQDIADIILNERLKGSLIPTNDTFVRDRILATTESAYGVQRKQWQQEIINKPSWLQAVQIVVSQVENNDLFKPARESLQSTRLSEDQINTLLDRFTYSLTNHFLENDDEVTRQEYFKDLISKVIEQINSENFRIFSTVKLRGVAFPAREILINLSGTEFQLRQVSVADLSQEQRYPGYREKLSIDPTAILSIHFLGIYPHEIQDKVEQAICILRLFKTGSVGYSSYTIENDSLLDPAPGIGTIFNGNSSVGLETYIVEETDKLILEKFWKAISAVLPSKGLGRNIESVDAVEIAYQHYSDALFTIGTTERKIAEAVMGLEALFLKGSENQELAYRLRMRVAKVFGLMGADAYEAKKVANDAYSIRSAFVHGDVVSSKDKRAIENRHTSLPILLKSVLDHLRISIVMFLLSKVEKDTLLNLLDDSYIDQTKLPELEELLNPVISHINTVDIFLGR